jgi:DNA-binding MarR family transcriptional regulator
LYFSSSYDHLGGDRIIVARTSRSSDEALDESSLDSAQLRAVLANYSRVRRPNLAVAATAVFRAEKILTAKMGTALDALELSPDRYEILALLNYTRGGRMSLKDLGNAALRHPATTTYTADVLEKRGLIKREPDPRDRRGVLARITPAGRDLVRRAAKLLELIDWGLDELSDEEAAVVARVLSRLHPA